MSVDNSKSWIMITNVRVDQQKLNFVEIEIKGPNENILELPGKKNEDRETVVLSRECNEEEYSAFRQALIEVRFDFNLEKLVNDPRKSCIGYQGKYEDVMAFVKFLETVDLTRPDFNQPSILVNPY